MAGLMRNAVVAAIGIAAGVAGMWALSGGLTSTVSAAVAELNPDAWMDSEEGVLAKLDELAGLPGDPDLPEGIVGASDEEIAALDGEMRAGLIELGEIATQGSFAAPRHSLALARLKASIGDEAAIALLEQSAQAGSAAAHALLGQMATQSEDTEAAAVLAIDHYNKAVEGGYEPARAPMERITALLKTAREQQRLAIEAKKKEILSEFKRPDYIDAMKRADAGFFRDEGLKGMAYLSLLNQALEAPGVTEQVPGLFDAINPKAAAYVQQKIAFSPRSYDDALKMSLNMIIGMGSAIRENEQRGGTIGEGTAAIMKSMMNGENSVGTEMEDGQHDGIKLATLFAVDPDAFKEIYAGNLTVLQGL